MQRTAVFGSGGHGKVLLDVLLKMKKYRVLGFFDDDPKKLDKEIGEFMVLGNFEDMLARRKEVQNVVIAIGNNVVRANLTEKAMNGGLKVPTVIHPSVQIGYKAVIEGAVQLLPGAIVNTFATVGEGSVVNTGATLDHDNRIGRFCHIWPGAHLAGTVTVGDFSYIGIGASVIENITIGKNVLVAAGAAVVDDVPDNVLVAGVPARIKKKR